MRPIVKDRLDITPPNPYGVINMDNEKWNRRYEGEDLIWPQEPGPLLEENVKDLAPGKALDLAAGEGRNSIYLAKRGWKVHAIDFSDVAVGKGRRMTERLGLPVRWEVKDLTTFTPQRESYDLVILYYLHMPWSDISDVFKKAAAAVRPKGFLMIVGHDLSNIQEGVGGPQDPKVLYTAEKITRLLTGMKVLQADKMRRPLDHEGAESSREHTGASTGSSTGTVTDAGAVDCFVLARRE